MVGALMQSTNFPSTISGESEIYSKRYGNTKRAVKMMCSLQTPPMSARTFSGLRGVNALDNMVNRSQDLHSKVATATSIRKAKPSRIAPKAMFERFTEKAIKVIMVAQEEARQLGNNFVGPEMILLGLTSEGTGIAATVLKSMGIHLKDARVEVEKVIGRGSGFVAVEIPFTPRAKRVIQLSLEEARQLGHDYIGSEHLLLGLLREDDWVVAHDLENLGVDRKNIRSRVHINDGGNGTVVVEIPLTPRGKLGLVETLKEGEKLEDFLLGLLREDDGVALRVLKNLGADPFNIRKEVMKMVGESAEVVGAGVGGRSYWNKMLTQEYNDTNFDKLADEGKLDPFVEWQPQIERDTQIPVGLTKTKPETIEGKKVITLELRELEGRLKKLIKLSDEIISFIDEFHTLIGARAGEGGIDAA